MKKMKRVMHQQKEVEKEILNLLKENKDYSILEIVNSLPYMVSDTLKLIGIMQKNKLINIKI